MYYDENVIGCGNGWAFFVVELCIGSCWGEGGICLYLCIFHYWGWWWQYWLTVISDNKGLDRFCWKFSNSRLWISDYPVVVEGTLLLDHFLRGKTITIHTSLLVVFSWTSLWCCSSPDFLWCLSLHICKYLTDLWPKMILFESILEIMEQRMLKWKQQLIWAGKVLGELPKGKRLLIKGTRVTILWWWPQCFSSEFEWGTNLMLS